MNINREDLAWAAGFFDGEGNIHSRWRTFNRANGKKSHSPMIAMSITNTFEPNVNRFHQAVGCLGRYWEKPQLPNRQQTWRWEASSHHEVQAIIALLWFKLGAEKRFDAYVSLELLNNYYKIHKAIPGDRRRNGFSSR